MKTIEVFYKDGPVTFQCDDVKFTSQGYIFLEVDKQVMTIIGPDFKWIDIHRDGYESSREWL